MSDLEINSISVSATTLGGNLLQILDEKVEPGSDISYELAKAIYLYHPLGRKMAESPVAMAQSLPRKITVQDAPDEVVQAFEEEFERLGATAIIRNLKTLSRVYGIATVVAGCKQVTPGAALDMSKVWEQDVYFNVLDPLNTAGSLVLSQIPTASDFERPVTVQTNGETFHRSRYQVAMNEAPIYLAYTVTAFGFVGRSVYQRALFPLKSFIRSMIADDMIAMKLGLLIAKQEQPGSIIDNVMQKIAGVKRAILKRGQTGNVLSISTKEEIETLNMMNVDGAGTYSRNNILKNAATAGDMPASFLNNETMVSGFGEGTEDAKNIARFLDSMRAECQPHYAWFDNFAQYRAWNPHFIERMQRKYPDLYGEMDARDIFSAWRANFAAEWPSFLIEPESETVKVEAVRLESTVAMLQTLIEQVDPASRVMLVEWAADNVSENKHMFPHALELDWEKLEEYMEETATQPQANDPSGVESVGPEAKKFARFDSAARGRAALGRLRLAVDSMQPKRVQ